MKNYEIKIKLSFDDSQTRYFVNKKKKSVTCIMRAYLLSCCNGIYMANEYPFRFEDVKGVGVAKCSSEDVFDENLGKSMARVRAESDAYLIATRILKRTEEKVKVLISAIKKFDTKAFTCMAHNDDYVDNLLDEYEKKVTFFQTMGSCSESD